MSEFLDIENREKDYNEIYSETFRAEVGIRAIGLIYHDHSDDQNSEENVFRLKDNIEYRLFSASHQYLLLLKELGAAELYLQNIYNKNPHFINPNTFPFGNRYFDKVERELSSIFDSIIFHLSSVFDYLSHAICYMYFNNKENTLYWTKLSKKVRGDLKGKFEFCKVLDEVDRKFVGRLYDYRSRLLHNKRDNHNFSSNMNLDDLSFQLKIAASKEVLKHFKMVEENKSSEKQEITLALKHDGTIWAWGNNSSSELGDNTTINKDIPTQIGTDTDWLHIFATTYSSYAIKNNGTLWTWGNNLNYEMGNGTTLNINIPTQINNDNNWERVVSRGSHVEALKTDNSIYYWGANYGFLPATIVSLPTMMANNCSLSSESFYTDVKVQLFPNPSNHIITIENRSNQIITSIIFIDMLGKNVIAMDKNFDSISVENLEKGIYHVIINFENNIIETLKFIKK